MENYKPFISEGVVSLVVDENSSQKVKILRDTGATLVLPLTENSFTGANVLIIGAFGVYRVIGHVCLSVCLFVCMFVCPSIFYETVRHRKVKSCG